jgi:hypothetical protein
VIARDRLPDAAIRRPRPAPTPPLVQRSHTAPADAGHGCACGGTCPKCSGRAADDAAASGRRVAARDNGGGGSGSGGAGSGSGSGCASTKTLSIDFVKLRAASRNPTPDLAFANRVFAPACVQFTSAGVHTATTVQSDGWLGGDTDLDSGPCPATAEELKLVNGAVAAFSLSSRLKAFFVASLSSGARGNSAPPYCGGTTVAVNTIAVTNSGASRTLAHEIGHVLLDSGDHPAATDNLMHPTNTSTGENLTATQRSTIFANA